MQRQKKEFANASKDPAVLKVIVQVLQSKNVSECWSGNFAEDVKTEIYGNVVQRAFSPGSKLIKETNRETNRRVFAAFQALNEVFLALETCPCSDIKEEAIKNCQQSLNTAQLIEITNDFEGVTELPPDVVECYMVCLRNSIEREITNHTSHAQIVEMLKKLSTKEGKNEHQLQR